MEFSHGLESEIPNVRLLDRYEFTQESDDIFSEDFIGRVLIVNDEVDGFE